MRRAAVPSLPEGKFSSAYPNGIEIGDEPFLVIVSHKDNELVLLDGFFVLLRQR